MNPTHPRNRRLSRRRLLVGSSVLLMSSAGVAAAAPARARRTLVCICLRGGLDALSALVPYSEKSYYAARPTIAIPEPGKKHGSLALDAQFALHPSLEKLVPLYRAKQLALVPAAGSPHPTRSHFEARDYLETGVPGNAGLDGWLNRYLALTPERSQPLRAVAISELVPRALSGRAPVFALTDPEKVGVGRGKGSLGEGFARLYAGRTDPLSQSAQHMLETSEKVRDAAGQPYSPSNGAKYPAQGKRLMQVARLLKAGFDVEIAWIEFGGFDTHTGQAGPNSGLARSLRVLGDSMAAFHSDMGEAMHDIAVVVMSEFGRTVAQNGTDGTDHGHGGLMLVLGGPVLGGKIHGEWPGLAKSDLYQGRDLEVATDYRRVLGDIVSDHMGLTRFDGLFPGYQHSRLGLFASG